jgi:ribose 5-phosphate isomerase B
MHLDHAFLQLGCQRPVDLGDLPDDAERLRGYQLAAPVAQHPQHRQAHRDVDRSDRRVVSIAAAAPVKTCHSTRSTPGSRRAPIQPDRQPSTPSTVLTCHTLPVKVYIGSDHAGFELKNALVARVGELGHEAVDCGPEAYHAEDDYPPYCLFVGTQVVADTGSLGIVIGGSGNGEAIAANKVRGVRAAVAFSDETATLCREHNDANVLSLGARMYDQATAIHYAELFLATPFSGAERHVRRITLLSGYEASGALPPRSEDGAR